MLSGRIGAVLGRADQRAFSGGGRRAATDPDGKPINLPGLDEGSGEPIGSVVDAIF